MTAWAVLLHSVSPGRGHPLHRHHDERQRREGRVSGLGLPGPRDPLEVGCCHAVHQLRGEPPSLAGALVYWWFYL